MRFRCLLGLPCVLAVMVWTGCDSSSSKVEAQWRFVGLNTLSQQTNAPAAAAILARPEFPVMHKALVSRVAASLWELANDNTNLPAATRAALEPVATDLVDHLSLGQVLRGSSGKREWVVAIQGDAARAKAWEAGWNALFHARNGATPKSAVQFQAGWIVAVSDASLTPTKSVMTSLAQIPVAPQSVFHLDGNVDGVARYTLDAAARDGAIRTQGEWNQQTALPSTLPAWERPAFIRDPLVHFTAARGINAWIEQWGGLKSVTGTDVPNQLFVWGKAAATTNTPPLQSYVAARISNTTGWVERTFKALQAFYPAPPAAPIWSGQLSLDTAQNQVAVAGFPPVHVAPGTDGDRNYVVLGMMPQGNSRLTFPKELAAQVEQPDILFYQWENVGEAMSNFSAASGAFDILRLRLPSVKRPGIAWALSASSGMQDCVTEARKTGSSQVTLKRKSPAGLSAAEFLLLARWIDGDAPPRPKKPATR